MRRTAVVAAVALSACTGGGGGGEDGGGWTVSLDTLSHGAIHVVNTPPSPDPGPTWILEEELRIGSVDGEGPSAFGQVKGLVVTDDGRVAVLDAIAQEIRVFDAQGRHLATHGGEGEGPGEFLRAWGLMMDGEQRLWVPDHANARMSVVEPEGGFVQSYPLRVMSRGFVWSGVMAHDGRVLKPSIALQPERHRVLRVYDDQMVLLDSLPLRDDPPMDPRDPPGSFYWEAPGGLPSGYVGVPFYPQAQTVVDASGDVWSTAPGDPAYRIARWSPGGDTALVLEVARPPVPIPAAERDAAIAEVRAYLLERGGADQDWSKVPRVKPAVAWMFPTEDGRLWVRTPSQNDAGVFDVFGGDGRYEGTVATSLPILSWVRPTVRGDRVWAVVTDELDVPYVVRARMVPVGD